jgi:hypothetical protein
MTSIDDVGQTILRNKLLGRWAALKLGMKGREAEVYSDTLARATVDPEHNDVFMRVRKDFDAAGIAQSDEQIRRVMTELTLKAGNLMPKPLGDSMDAAAVTLARKLMAQ